jgi:GxxExxY protein
LLDPPSIAFFLQHSAEIFRRSCLLVELKAVEILHLSSKAQLLSYMKLLDIPVGLLINFHEPVLKNGISRMPRAAFFVFKLNRNLGRS